MTARIDARRLSVTRTGRQILQDVDVAIEPGRLTAIVGPNGSGKTTLLRTLAGLWPATAGDVRVNGQPLGSLSRRDIARSVAFLPQDTRVDFAFTVEEVVAMGRHPHRGRFAPEGDEDRRAIDEALSTCDLVSLRARTVDRLSGGERQRVAIGRCLATRPDTILLDEPTAHLDVAHALTILSLCRSLADGGAAVAVATHDLGGVIRHATHVLLLSEGRVAGFGPPGEVLTPERCRRVFAVDVETVTAADGTPALVFRPAEWTRS